jgi:hypothetical protein
MFRLSVLNQVSGIIKSSSFSGTCQIAPQRPDGSYSDPSYQTVRRRTPKTKVFVPPTRVRDVTEESGEPSWDSYQVNYFIFTDNIFHKIDHESTISHK